MEKDATRTMIDKIYESSQSWMREQHLQIEKSPQDWIDERIRQIDARALEGTLPKVAKAPPRKMTKEEKAHHRLRKLALSAPADCQLDLVFNYMAIEDQYSTTPDGISLMHAKAQEMVLYKNHHLDLYDASMRMSRDAFMLADINAKRAELRGARNS